MKTPVEVVQQQLDDYNRRDLAAFVANYADDIQVFRLPAREPALAGKEAFARQYETTRFNLPGLRAELVNRIAFGNKVRPRAHLRRAPGALRGGRGLRGARRAHRHGLVPGGGMTAFC